ncbi:beta-N-acetylhexosaminidase [Chitinophaga vietnamensis]|uniref:beta-N-acetylhexosaminidase n=1 Tax=Chitinophaga vietnamensis TaxID=2593957 RepID=UPI0011786756|nr:beta-N-acetylhexosaminidase [Chitinophaga vietnamensis]
MKKIITAVLLLCCQQTFAQTVCPVIPLPVKAVKTAATFGITDHTTIVAAAGMEPLAAYLQKELQARYHISLHRGASATGSIELRKTAASAQPEAYTLQVSGKKVVISGSDAEGVFNGITTLLQLLAATPDHRTIAGWQITDAPQYAWRGFMLDESRHFFGKEKVKALLSWMAFYKLNRFHWHLTDMNGWRLEIKQYPLLTTVGGIGNFSDSTAPATYYTQKDIAEIITYARERYITVIPEIDMPGHASAASRAYPEISGGGTGKYAGFTFNPGKAITYQFLTNVLREVNALFPAGMIHLGGDEVSFGNKSWDSDSGVVRLMRNQGFTDKKQVEDYFLQRMADSVYQLNSKVIAWDEIATGSFPTNKTIVCWWRHDKPEALKMALDKGYQVILCPRIPMYFDFVQDSSHHSGRRWKVGEFNTLRGVYEFAPAQQPQVLGIQGCLWTETVNNNNRFDFMIFPRLSALAEAAWTAPAQRNFDQFVPRLKQHLLLYQQADLYYFDPFHKGRHAETGKVTDEKGYID